MKRVIQLSGHELDQIIKKVIIEQSDLSERGQKGLWKPEWNEDDQILAMYNSLYGLEDLGVNQAYVADEIIGTSLGSLKQQTSNFDYLSGKGGLDRPHQLQSPVYEKYKDFSKSKLKELALSIIEKREKNPEDAVVKKRTGYEIGTARENLAKSRIEALKKAGLDPNRKWKVISSKPTIPEPEDTENSTDNTGPPRVADIRPPTKNHILDFVNSIREKLTNANTPEERNEVLNDLDFLSDYLALESTKKEGDELIAEITHIFKNIL